MLVSPSSNCCSELKGAEGEYFCIIKDNIKPKAIDVNVFRKHRVQSNAKILKLIDVKFVCDPRRKPKVLTQLA